MPGPEGDVEPLYFPMSGGPASAVGVPAEVLAAGRARVVCPPWAPLNVAKGDVYRVERRADGHLWAVEKLGASGFCAIRLDLHIDLESFEDEMDAVLAALAAWGVTGGGMFGLVVLDVPPEADLGRVRRFLADGRRAGRWDVVELCVTDHWRAAAP